MDHAMQFEKEPPPPRKIDSPVTVHPIHHAPVLRLRIHKKNVTIINQWLAECRANCQPALVSMGSVAPSDICYRVGSIIS